MRAAIDDGFHDHPKVLALLNHGLDGAAAIGLWTLAVSWAKGQADPDRPHLAGFVPRSLVVRWCGDDGPRLADMLVNVKPPGYEYGLWEATDDANWWRIHEFVQHQFLVEYAAKRDQAQRAARKRWGQDGPGLFDASADAGADADTERAQMRAHSGRNATTTTTTTKTNNPPNPPGGDLATAGFAAFWAAYPRKVSKPTALRAWAKAVRKADPDKIVAAAAAFAADPNLPPGQYIPHPGTWLNGERWNDPPLPSRNGRETQQQAMERGAAKAAQELAAERAARRGAHQ